MYSFFNNGEIKSVHKNNILKNSNKSKLKVKQILKLKQYLIVDIFCNTF